jgi:putative transposase
MEPCDRTTYGEKLRDAAEKLNLSVRSVQQLVRKWEVEGVAALTSSGRADRGTHRISEFWQTFIIKTYEDGNKGSKRMKPKQVALRVLAKARDIGDEKPLTHRGRSSR